jgi:hypothetical protein
MPLRTYLENIPNGAINNSTQDQNYFSSLFLNGRNERSRRWKVREHACARWLPIPTNNVFPIHTAQLIFSAKLAIRFPLANNCSRWRSNFKGRGWRGMYFFKSSRGTL